MCIGLKTRPGTALGNMLYECILVSFENKLNGSLSLYSLCSTVMEMLRAP